jgi:DNA-binding NarL/FixJ family response regulator
VVVVHSYLVHQDGESLAADIRRGHSESRVLVLSLLIDERHLRAMLEAGANGYLLTSEEPQAIVEAVRAVARGEFRLSDRLRELLVTLPQTKAAPPELSERELEVLRLVALGWENAAIAAELGLAVGTVKNHIVAIYSKLGVHSRVEAVVWALREGLVKIC